MKKVLLLPLLFVAMIANGQRLTDNSSKIDPRCYNFAPYWSSTYSVESLSITGRSRNAMFGGDVKDIDSLSDGISFVLKSDYYKLWVPDLAIMFTVKPIQNKTLSLGEHFIMLLQTLREYRSNNTVARSKP